MAAVLPSPLHSSLRTARKKMRAKCQLEREQARRAFGGWRRVHPGVHAAQAVEPGSAWKLPAAQLTHIDALSWSLKVPGAQSVATALPTEQKVPTGQIKHSLTFIITGSVGSFRLPAGQGSGALEPWMQ